MTQQFVKAWASMHGIPERDAAEQIMELLIYGQKENAPRQRDAVKNDITEF